MKIIAYNPPTTELEKTFITSDSLAATESILVKNNDRFADTNRILIGKMGHNRSEIGVIDEAIVAGQTIAVTALVFPHNADDPVYKLDFDQVRFYRSTTGISGTYSLVSTQAMDVDNANKITVYDDPTGLGSYYYKVAYYNSVSDTESPLSDPISGEGFAAATAGDIIDKVVRRIKDPGFTVMTAKEYLDVFGNVNDDLITQSHKPYRFLKVTQTLTPVADQNYVNLSSLVPAMWKFDFLKYTYGSGSQVETYRPTVISLEEFIDKYDGRTYASNDRIQEVAIDENKNRLLMHPAPKTATTNALEFYYFKNFDKIDTEGDFIETPTQSIYEYALRAEYYLIRAEDDKTFLNLAQKFETKYGNEVVKMQRINRLDTGTPRSMSPPVAARSRRFHL